MRLRPSLPLLTLAAAAALVAALAGWALVTTLRTPEVGAVAPIDLPVTSSAGTPLPARPDAAGAPVLGPTPPAAGAAGAAGTPGRAADPPARAGDDDDRGGDDDDRAGDDDDRAGDDDDDDDDD